MEFTLYSDASSDITNEISTGGFILTYKDNNICTCSATLEHFKDTVHVEAQAMLLGMKTAYAMGCTHLMAMTDSSVLTDKIKRFKGTEPPSMKILISYIRNFSRKFKSFRYYPVESYLVDAAHNLAKGRLIAIRDRDDQDVF